MYYYLLRTTDFWLFLHNCLFNVGLVIPYYASCFCRFVLLYVRVVRKLLCILIILGIPLTFRIVYICFYNFTVYSDVFVVEKKQVITTNQYIVSEYRWIAQL